MNADHDASVTVEVTLKGRRATIEDVQDALDTLRREGIPETFEVDVDQRQERVWEDGVPVRDQKLEHALTVSAARAASMGA